MHSETSEYSWQTYPRRVFQKSTILWWVSVFFLCCSRCAMVKLISLWILSITKCKKSKVCKFVWSPWDIHSIRVMSSDWSNSHYEVISSYIMLGDIACWFDNRYTAPQRTGVTRLFEWASFRVDLLKVVMGYGVMSASVIGIFCPGGLRSRCPAIDRWPWLCSPLLAAGCWFVFGKGRLLPNFLPPRHVECQLKIPKYKKIAFVIGLTTDQMFGHCKSQWFVVGEDGECSAFEVVAEMSYAQINR